MSGIFAITGMIEDDKIEQVLQSMHHRGPDECEEILLGSFYLAYRRLAIVGKSEGKQPIANKKKTKWIVANGEIYNHKQLKNSILKGEQFTTKSDCEVALKLYETKGSSAVKYLDGMFAFVIADTDQNTFMAARDTLGIKPLYYGKDSDDNTVFASELKTLYIVTDDVHEFPPGHYYTPEEGFVSYRKIEKPNQQDIFNENDMSWMMQGIREHLNDAVQKCFMADTEVGVLLSGGLDSSLIALLAKENNQRNIPLKSFCVGSENSDDVMRAREVAAEIGSEHYEYIFTEQDLIECLPKVIYHLESYDASLVRSAIPNFFVSKLAAEHVKVILSGEGADELFSGYQYLKSIDSTEKLNEELIRILNTMHNINLQRADRMSMAHSVELRAPFLDLNLIEYALKIPAKLKLKDGDMEKWILRESYDGILADNIIWMDKAEFSEGSGALVILQSYANGKYSDEELAKAHRENEFVRSKQELLYYHIFKEFYPSSSILSTIGTWATV